LAALALELVLTWAAVKVFKCLDLEQAPELALELAQAPELAPELALELAPELALELAPELALELALIMV
jgi:hypothetical protein